MFITLAPNSSNNLVGFFFELTCGIIMVIFAFSPKGGNEEELGTSQNGLL
jgi:hypothetical protein